MKIEIEKENLGLIMKIFNIFIFLLIVLNTIFRPSKSDDTHDKSEDTSSKIDEKTVNQNTFLIQFNHYMPSEFLSVSSGLPVSVV